jgi:hypothetical protein
LSTVTGCGTGIFITSGTAVFIFGNNQVFNNTTNVNGTTSPMGRL